MSATTDILHGKWEQMKGDARKNWGKLTDDDITKVQGNHDKLVGSLQERYGWDKMKATSEVDRWVTNYKVPETVR